MLTFQALANSRFFRQDCGVNISCKPHVLQADLFLKIYSSIWLSQKFLGYNSIEKKKNVEKSILTNAGYLSTMNILILFLLVTTHILLIPFNPRGYQIRKL
jgi:hypothetical protein